MSSSFFVTHKYINRNFAGTDFYALIYPLTLLELKNIKLLYSNREVDACLRLNVAKNNDNIKTSFKQKSFKIEFPTKKSAGACFYPHRDEARGFQRSLQFFQYFWFGPVCFFSTRESILREFLFFVMFSHKFCQKME